MTRTKVKLAYIVNDSERKATFKRRKTGIMKKAEELSILCGVDTCAIIFSPYDPEPEVWPSHLEAQRIIAKLRNLSPLAQNRKMVNQKDFVRNQLGRVNDQMLKLRKEVRVKELTDIMYECLNGMGFEYFNLSDLNEMNGVLSQSIKDIDSRMINFP